MQSIDEIRPQLEAIIKGIAKQFGKNCEVVIHDHLKGLDHSIVAIENGHVTGRKIGDPSTNIGFEIQKQNGQWHDQYGYISKLLNGKTIRSSSVYFKNDQGKVIGSLCINLDISELVAVNAAVKELCRPQEAEPVNEVFSSNVGDILDNLAADYISKKGLSIEHMTKHDMLGLISYLDAKGAFLIRNSAMKVCHLLGISKYTLYAYLKELDAS